MTNGRGGACGNGEARPQPHSSFVIRHSFLIASNQGGRFNECAETMKANHSSLVLLAREMGREDRQLAILSEGNVSAKLSPSQFAVKASGCSLATLTDAEVTVCNTAKVLSLLEQKHVSDESIDQALLDTRVEAKAKKPSVEAIFHAWLLTFDDVNFVGHCHPISANQVLCSPRARDFAERRLFPDEIHYCGAASVFVPYADPGLPLAREIAERTKAFYQQNGQVPRLILLQNHGIIALGPTVEAVLACLLMANKAATVFMGAAAMGGPNFLTPAHVERIAGRLDQS
jgi:rhamnose utilization protein RhaD (predicted bifunctional aldolase and dehydrogenase)